MSCWEAWFGKAPDNTVLPTWDAELTATNKTRTQETWKAQSSRKLGDALTATCLGFAYQLGHNLKGFIVLLKDKKIIGGAQQPAKPGLQLEARRTKGR
jgi:hypothetical protein